MKRPLPYIESKPVTTPPTREAMIDFIIKRAHPEAWGAMKLPRSFADPNPPPYPSAAVQTARADIAKLERASSTKIKKRYKEECDKSIAEQLQRSKDREAGLPFNLPYNRLSAESLEHWSAQPFWQMDEAITLSFGLDPDRITWTASVRPFVEVSPLREEILAHL